MKVEQPIPFSSQRRRCQFHRFRRQSNMKKPMNPTIHRLFYFAEYINAASPTFTTVSFYIFPCLSTYITLSISLSVVNADGDILTVPVSRVPIAS